MRAVVLSGTTRSCARMITQGLLLGTMITNLQMMNRNSDCKHEIPKVRHHQHLDHLHHHPHHPHHPPHHPHPPHHGVVFSGSMEPVVQSAATS